MATTKAAYTEHVEGFDIALFLLPEDFEPYWPDDPDDRAQLLRDIENGTYLWFCAKITASRYGIELGSEYLGACCYESIEQFVADDYYADIRATAIADARANIALLTQAA